MRNLLWILLAALLFGGNAVYDMRTTTQAIGEVHIGSSATAAEQQRFLQFAEHLAQGQEDAIRLVQHSAEGDPVYLDLHFTNGELGVKVDTTADSFGSGRVFKVSCSPELIKTDFGSYYEYRIGFCLYLDRSPRIYTLPK
ncbi:uncharacterized protein DUF4362 [Tumebacillus sp. BK434]|uniref:DUF4362 domain-containing protein n=1 Tax=Tumebacillus sp. BK434 TaxID=2512169 RepID=UPI0010513210|nr:DUF4362 domain-containing protein [Tumebacillus sp. BK434]TCP54496.1 uncharacterized protein DUF4362 [Tumebacillus sp. BK434]